MANEQPPLATTPLENWPVNGFVVKDWTGIKPGEEPVCIVLNTAQIFDFLTEPATRQRQIAIFPVGPCVLNWSQHETG